MSDQGPDKGVRSALELLHRASPNQIDWHELLDAELQYENVNDRFDD